MPPVDTQTVIRGLRDAVDASIADGGYALALHQAEELWRLAPSLATAGFIKTRIKPQAEALGFAAKRLVILRSFTVETMLPILETCGLLSRYCLEIRPGEYNAYLQELMAAPQSPAPDATLIALHTRTAAPALWTGADAAEMAKASGWLIENLRRGLEMYRDACGSPLLLQLLDSPASPGAAMVVETNEHLKRIAAEVPDCHVIDINGLIKSHGAQWYDDRNWAVAKVPFRNTYAPDLAAQWFRHIRPVLGAPAKVLVVDLDNTLWGGILGEDGAAGLRMGEGYAEVQRALIALKERGVLLAISSKNDEAAALSVLSSHPQCLLRPDDFVAMRINWAPKSDNIRAIAEDLSLGLDSLMFLDDNPVERAEIARTLPMVRLMPFDSDPAINGRTLVSYPDLQRLTVTAEDRARTAMYRARKAREASSGQVETSREEFLASLQQQVLVEALSDEVFIRLADLERKTNQFNMRTRRFSEGDLRRFATGPNAFITVFRVVDRFGDNGVIGLAVVSVDGAVAHIESLLMSCRVIGRNVEKAMLHEIARAARQRGCAELMGSFATTDKNTPARDFYRDNGFSPISGGAEGENVEFWRRGIDERLTGGLE